MRELPVIIVQLVHIQGPLKGQIQEFTDQTITLGRHPSCQVHFPTEITTLSRKHAELIREGNRYKIVDHSANGTFVNGKRITETYLKDGDVIMLTEGGPKVSYLASITDAVMKEPAGEPPAAPPVQQTPPVEPPAFVPPVMTAAPARPASPEVEAAAPPRAAPAAPMKPADVPVKPASPPRQTVQKVQVPLIVQFGPMLKSYKELPIVIGKKADADFVMNHPAVLDAHAQIFFSQNQYWIKDLTGKGLITIGSRAIGFETPLAAQDIISLAPGGPSLIFLGEGRLAEHEEPQAEESAPAALPTKPEPAKKASKSIFDIFKK